MATMAPTAVMNPDSGTVDPPKRKVLKNHQSVNAALKQPGIYHDSEYSQLELRVRESGATSWSVRYRVPGRKNPSRLTLGSFPQITLADARERAKAALRSVDDGVDPAVEKQQRREADTFKELADKYIAKHAKPNKKSWKDDQRNLNTNILPDWKNRLVRDITRRDVRELVDGIAERAPVLANRIVALLSRVFTFAIDAEVVDASPMAGFKRPTKEQARDRVLTDDELRAFWTVTDTFDAPMAAFWKLRLLTAQRSVEVNTMKWSDIDGEWWTIPATVAKNKLSHRVPLSSAALDILKELPPSTFVVEGARGKRQQAEAAAQFGIDDFRGHDLRRTAASKMTSAGISRFVVGKVLNHVESGVTKVYDRHSYDAEKRIALDTWARTLDGILKAKPGADVLPFITKKA
jgi:integrase